MKWKNVNSFSYKLESYRESITPLTEKFVRGYLYALRQRRNTAESKEMSDGESVTALPVEADGIRDIRTARAKSVWQALSRRVSNVISFEQYLIQTPFLPEFSPEVARRLPYTVLVDPRFGVTEVCRLVEVYFAGSDTSYVHSKPRKDELKAPYWTRMGVGIGVEEKFASMQLPTSRAHATAVEGAFFLLQHPYFLKEHTAKLMLICGGSTWPNHPGRPAYYRYWNYQSPKGEFKGNSYVRGELALHLWDKGMNSVSVPKLVRFRP